MHGINIFSLTMPWYYELCCSVKLKEKTEELSIFRLSPNTNFRLFFTSFQHTPATKAIYMWLINCPNFSSCFQGCYLFRSILSTVWLTWQHIMLRPPNETAIPFTLVPHYYMIRKMLRQKKSLDSITSSHTSKVIIVWLVHKIILMPFRWYPGQDIRWWYSWYCTKSL